MSNYNGFWIGWLDLLTPSLQSFITKSITRAHNQWQPRTRSILAGLRLSSLLVFLLLNDLVQVYESRTTNDEGRITYDWINLKVKVKVTLRLTVSQSVSLGIEPHLGPMTRYLFLSGTYVLVSVGRPLWREDGSVLCMCRWPLPAQSFSGPSPLGLATVFYCLKFETSLFVASYDSQGHSGGIRPRFHTGLNQSPLHHRLHNLAVTMGNVCCLFVDMETCFVPRWSLGIYLHRNVC
jgi:hypothetical protein